MYSKSHTFYSLDSHVDIMYDNDLYILQVVPVNKEL